LKKAQIWAGKSQGSFGVAVGGPSMPGIQKKVMPHLFVEIC
jgi:hypothetical protein